MNFVPARSWPIKSQILMTPVLIVNGKLKHHGSVPEPEWVRTWLREAAGEG